MATKVVLKNGDTRWKERIVVGGKRQLFTAATKKELDDLVDEMKTRERRRKLGIAEPTGDITFGDLAGKMIDRYMKREASLVHLKKSLTYSLPVFGTWLVRDITTEDVEDWISKLTGKRGGPLSASSKGHYLGAVRQVLNYGVERDYLTKNVAAKVTGPKIETDAADPFESWEEVEQLADALGAIYDRGKQLVMFVCSTGLRPQEWQVLRWSDFDLTVPHARISRTMQLEGEQALGKTKGSLGAVLLQERALQALRELPRPLDGKELVFPGPNGEPWNLATFRYGTKTDKRGPWLLAMEAAGLHYRGPKNMRHTFATLSLEAGVPLEWISRQLRHTTIVQTARAYARWTAKAEHRWLDVLNTAGTNQPLDLLKGLDLAESK